MKLGIVIIAAIVVLALISTSAHPMGLALLVTIAIGAASATAAVVDEATKIQPFSVNVSDAELADLKRRLAATLAVTRLSCQVGRGPAPKS